MKSAIKRFTEARTDNSGDTWDSLRDELDLLELEVLKRFDTWRPGKTIINTFFERIMAGQVGSESWITLTVLYEVQ
jgi:hypothetical protein